MNAQDDFGKAMLFQHPDRIPVTADILPGAWAKYREALSALVARHADLFPGHVEEAGTDYDTMDGVYMIGEHTDAWGCVWNNAQAGVHAIVTKHPVPTREAVRDLKMPDQDIGLPHGFMFLRLTDLRGFEEMMVDFAEEPPELQGLIDLVLAYNLRQADLQVRELKGTGHLVCLGDDLGMQTSLPISPETWRRYLKPCYRAIYKPFLEAGHYIYMHTDGHILEIIPDLIDCGAHVINPQVRANGLDNLAAVAKGRVCIALDLDRQLFPFCTPADIEAHVQEAVAKLGAPEGGLWLKAEVDHGVPLENIEAICCALENCRDTFNSTG